MSCSQRKAVITLIEKQGKDRTLIENWRPISLINVDAKVISKVIAVRVKNVLPSIIHHNQTGYLTRLSAINNFEGGGIKMIDIESMVKALRLAWLKRIFIDNESTWKTYLLYLLKDFWGSLIFECNYTMKDLSIISIFYRELLQWWSEFRDHFSDEKYWLSIIWNHKDIRINGKPVFYKTYYNSGIYTVSDLLLNLDNVESFEAIKNKI